MYISEKKIRNLIGQYFLSEDADKKGGSLPDWTKKKLETALVQRAMAAAAKLTDPAEIRKALGVSKAGAIDGKFDGDWGKSTQALWKELTGSDEVPNSKDTAIAKVSGKSTSAPKTKAKTTTAQDKETEALDPTASKSTASTTTTTSQKEKQTAPPEGEKASAIYNLGEKIKSNAAVYINRYKNEINNFNMSPDENDKLKNIFYMGIYQNPEYVKTYYKALGSDNPPKYSDNVGNDLKTIYDSKISLKSKLMLKNSSIVKYYKFNINFTDISFDMFISLKKDRSTFKINVKKGKLSKDSPDEPSKHDLTQDVLISDYIQQTGAFWSRIPRITIESAKINSPIGSKGGNSYYVPNKAINFKGMGDYSPELLEKLSQFIIHPGKHKKNKFSAVGQGEDRVVYVAPLESEEFKKSLLSHIDAVFKPISEPKAISRAELCYILGVAITKLAGQIKD